MDWETTMKIVDFIRQGDANPKATVVGMLGKLKNTNPNVVLLAVQVFESIVKNCGKVVHEQIATREVMEEMREILHSTSNEEAQKKIIALLAAWVYAFRNEIKYRAVQDVVNILKAEGYHFPTVIESDAMFMADRAPEWADGECCHRCRSNFHVLRRKHHCRACGQVFCSDCSSKYSVIPKFGIEKEVRVCESCYEEINNPQRNAPKPKADSIPAIQNAKSTPTKKTTEAAGNKKSAEEIQEEEELQLALALSRSEAENKEKEKLRATAALLGGNWSHSPQVSPPSSPPYVSKQPKEELDPELAKYLDRSYWDQQRQNQQGKSYTTSSSAKDTRRECVLTPTQPSAPSTKAAEHVITTKLYQNGETDDVDDFMTTLRGQLEIFVNRMKSNQSRGRPIANDTAVQSLFMSITAMHSQLLKCIQEQDNKRVHCEQLQDKISQIRDARAALEALREEHREKLRREKEEQDRIRQIQMMQKLEIMRKKKQEYLEYQRQLALHRMAESERQIIGTQRSVLPQPYNIPFQGIPQTQVPHLQGYVYPQPGVPLPQQGETVPANLPPNLGYPAPPATQPQLGLFQPSPVPASGPNIPTSVPPVVTSMPGGPYPTGHPEYPFNMQVLAGSLPSVPPGYQGQRVMQSSVTPQDQISVGGQVPISGVPVLQGAQPVSPSQLNATSGPVSQVPSHMTQNAALMQNPMAPLPQQAHPPPQQEEQQAELITFD